MRSSCSLLTLLRLAAAEYVDWLPVAERVPDVMVRWVTLNLETAEPGDALLLPASELTPALIETAHQKGIVALVALGTITEPAAFAGAPLPLAALPEHSDLQTTYRLLLTILINQRAHLLEWGIGIHARLDQMAAEGADLQGLVDVMAELSGRCILMQDKRMDVLAVHVPPTLQAVWDSMLPRLTVRASLPEPLQDRRQAGKQTALLTQALEGGFVRLVTSINVSGMARGYLSLIGLVGELDSLDQVIVEQGAVVCAVQMARSKAVRETEKRVKSDLLAALLRGELSPRDIQLWRESMGLDLTQPHVAVRFAWDSSGAPSLRRLETLVNGEVARLGSKVIVSLMDEEVVCFCQGRPGEPRPETALTLARSVLDRATLKYPDSSPRCGVGTPAAALADWRHSFRQAGQTLEMARRLAENRPLYFPDLSVYRL